MLIRAGLYVFAPFAILGVLLNIAWGLFATTLLFRFMSRATQNRVIRFWSRALLRIVGVRYVFHGETPDLALARMGANAQGHGLMLLANHVSWLDIHAIHATVPTCFVAKAEIARWPVLGTLAARTGTLFVERGRRRAVHAMNHSIMERLRQGEIVGVFPEGTTTGGDTLLPFHANLIQPALDVGAQLRPLALRYTENGRRSRTAAYTDGDHLLQSLWRIVTMPRLKVDVYWLPPLPQDVERRHEAGRLAREAIADTLGIALDAMSVSPAGRVDSVTADTAPRSAVDPAN